MSQAGGARAFRLRRTGQFPYNTRQTPVSSEKPNPSMKHRLRFLAPWLCAAAAFVPCAPAAPRIVWVSDLLPVNSGTSDNSGGSVGVFGPGTGPYADEEFLTLLTTAGYEVDRYNPPDGGAPVPDDEVALLNGYDLIILARALNSGGFDSLDEALPWNTKITQPILSTNVFLVRRVRLGWFTGSSGNGEAAGLFSAHLSFADVQEPVSAHLSGAVAMTGSTTTESLWRQITTFVNADRGQNFMASNQTIVPGGTVLATAQENGGAAVAVLPAGTVVKPVSGGADHVLAGFRMLFTAGNQEPSVSPENVIGNAGFNNLTAAGQAMFLRAVEVAMANGQVPSSPQAPALTIAQDAGNVRLEWADAQWVLEASDTLADESWEDVSQVSPATLPIAAGARYFRLRFAP